MSMFSKNEKDQSFNVGRNGTRNTTQNTRYVFIFGCIADKISVSFSLHVFGVALCAFNDKL